MSSHRRWLSNCCTEPFLSTTKGRKATKNAEIKPNSSWVVFLLKKKYYLPKKKKKENKNCQRLDHIFTIASQLRGATQPPGFPWPFRHWSAQDAWPALQHRPPVAPTWLLPALYRCLRYSGTSQLEAVVSVPSPSCSSWPRVSLYSLRAAYNGSELS